MLYIIQINATIYCLLKNIETDQQGRPTQEIHIQNYVYNKMKKKNLTFPQTQNLLCRKKELRLLQQLPSKILSQSDHTIT